MKRKTLAAIAILTAAISSPVYAYCETRGERCWQNMIKSTNEGIARRFDAIDRSPASFEYKQQVADHINKWSDNINRQCRTSQCIAKSNFELSMWVGKEWIKVRKTFNLKDVQ